MAAKISRMLPVLILCICMILLGGCSGNDTPPEYYSIVALLSGKESIRGRVIGTNGYLELEGGDRPRLYLSKQDLADRRFSNSVTVYNLAASSETLGLVEGRLCLVEGRYEMHSGIAYLHDVQLLDCRYDYEGEVPKD